VLREQDVDQLRESDLAFLGGKDTATLGDITRGESVKTGVDQGVEFQRRWVNRILGRYVRGRGGQKVFPFSMVTYRKGFQRRLRRSRVTGVTGPQRFRHSAAAKMVAEAGPEDKGVFERLRRRGRWADLRSVQVYSKTHLLTRILARLDSEVLRRGAYLMENTDAIAEVWTEAFEAAGREGGRWCRTRRGLLGCSLRRTSWCLRGTAGRQRS
jgi:hypothetical protein